MTIKLKVNGENLDYHGDPRTSLLDALRQTFRMTGSKAVCCEGFCGACTVHIDGKPTASCLKPVGLLNGANITTIEGVGTTEKLNPVQQALEDHDVVQCGMCFPGIVMTFTAYLKDNPTPTREEIKTAMVGNICRCTGYERIIDALVSVGEMEGAKS